MNKLHFSHNWNNKLDCKIFTTIRKYTPEKWKYYFMQIGKPFDVQLNHRHHTIVELRSSTRQIFKTIPVLMLRQDVGCYEIDPIHKVFSSFGIRADTEVIILTLENG